MTLFPLILMCMQAKVGESEDPELMWRFARCHYDLAEGESVGVG